MNDAAWVALCLTGRVGMKTLRALRVYFNTPEAILAASEAELRRVPGIGPRIARSIREIDLPAVEAAMAHWRNQGVRILPPHAADYPRSLAGLDDAPATLFVCGKWPPPPRRAALVGTRSPSPGAHQAAQKLAMRLAEEDWCIVSGLAIGIDAAAHTGALAVPDGVTLAVLGSGVLNPYPPQNRSLAEAILVRGALLAEANPTVGPNAAQLVARNRIITGLSQVVFVVETESDGGAMYAARFAAAQGRRIAVLDLPASGNRALLEAGALPVALDLSNLASVL